MLSNNTLHAVAIHEAGHAIAAQFFGLQVGVLSLDLGNERALGRTEIGPDDHLAIVDRVTVRIAGIAAQNLFKCATDEWIGMSDYMRIGALVSRLGNNQSLEVRAVAYQCAYDILRTRRHEAKLVAQLLSKFGRVNFVCLNSYFPSSITRTQRTRSPTARLAFSPPMSRITAMPSKTGRCICRKSGRTIARA